MTISAVEFSFVRQLVNDHSAISLDDGKEYLVEMRLSSLIRKIGIGSISDLVSQLKTGAVDTLRQLVVEAMTTNETSFFRDGHPFDALKTQILPEVVKRCRSKQSLSIWCAASSSGQEPYSIAMMLRDSFPEVLKWNLKYLATDISEGVLSQARQGRFSQLEVNRGLPAPYLVKYFRPEKHDWVLNEDVRKMVDFRYMNLNQKWLPMPQLDLVFIRNVLIYFTDETKKRILARIASMMHPEGYLFLGSTETAFNLDSSYQRVPLGKTVCYRLANGGTAKT